MIIDGKKIALDIERAVLLNSQNLYKNKGITPCLAVILVGDDPASQIYVSNKLKKAESCGVLSKKYILDESTSQAELLNLISQLNQDTDVHGILVQLPLPKHIEKTLVIDAILPSKDVDGFHPYNIGEIFTNQLTEQSLVPCTPKGCLKLIKHALGLNLKGLNAVIVGASNIVGRPMAGLLLNEKCTVTICHKHTQNLSQITKSADILVVAAGVPNLISGEMLKKGACVIDVGINRIASEDGKGKIVGDCDFETCSRVAGYLTPVPGGVGPMTIACLLENTILAAHSAKPL